MREVLVCKMSTATASQLDEFQDIIQRMDRITQYQRAHSAPGPTHRPPLPLPKLPDSAVDGDYVRVNIGIDEDLKMILDMDPSLIDDPLPDEPVDKFLGWPAPTNW